MTSHIEGTFYAVYAALNSLPMIGRNGVNELNVVKLTKTMQQSRRHNRSLSCLQLLAAQGCAVYSCSYLDPFEI